MSDASDLKEIFGRYAGKEIKDPSRVTCDCDAVMDDLTQEVIQAGFFPVRAHEKGTLVAGRAARANRVSAEFEKDAGGTLRLTGHFKLGS